MHLMWANSKQKKQKPLSKEYEREKKHTQKKNCDTKVVLEIEEGI